MDNEKDKHLRSLRDLFAKLWKRGKDDKESENTTDLILEMLERGENPISSILLGDTWLDNQLDSRLDSRTIDHIKAYFDDVEDWDCDDW